MSMSKSPASAAIEAGATGSGPELFVEPGSETALRWSVGASARPSLVPVRAV
jgi:hypothetical protein